MAWRGSPGTGYLNINGNFKVASANNILIGAGANPASGQAVCAIGNAVSVPSSKSFNGGVLYVNSGRLYYLGGQGTKTGLSATPVPSLAAWNIDTGSGTATYTLTKPTGTVSGDVLFAFMNIQLNATIAASGWTVVQTESGLSRSAYSYGIYSLVAGGAEPASYGFTGSAANYQSVIARITKTSVQNPLAGSQIVSGSSSSHTPQITPTRQLALVVGAMGGNATLTDTAAAPTNPTWTTLVNTEQNNIRIIFGHLTDSHRISETISATFQLLTSDAPSAAWLFATSDD